MPGKTIRILTTLLLFTALFANAQNTPPTSITENGWASPMGFVLPFEIDLDTTDFVPLLRNMFVSEVYTNAFISITADTSGVFYDEFNKVEPGIKTPAIIAGTVFGDQERFRVNNRDYIRILNAERVTHPDEPVMVMYNIAVSPGTSLLMSAACRKEDFEALFPIFEKAAQSLRLRK
jgi:hypothetical protein